MKNLRIEGKYSGVYFCVNYFNHIYEPTLETTKHLLNNFKHKYEIGSWYAYRENHKKTEYGKIERIAYSTEKNGGGTIKVYFINKKWIEESCIKNYGF